MTVKQQWNNSEVHSARKATVHSTQCMSCARRDRHLASVCRLLGMFSESLSTPQFFLNVHMKYIEGCQTHPGDDGSWHCGCVDSHEGHLGCCAGEKEARMCMVQILHFCAVDASQVWALELCRKNTLHIGHIWPFCTSACFEHLWFLEIAVITVLWYCTRMFHIVILWRSLQVGGNSWVWCRQRRPSLNKVFWHRMCLGVKGVKERCDKNTLWLAMRKNSEQGSSIFQDSQPNEDFQKRDSDTMEPQYLKRPWHHDCEKESKEDNTLAPDISNTQLQLIVSSLFELKYLLRYICCSHQGCLCSISLGCARHHERHRLDHPLDSRSESVTKEVTKAVTIQWIWILFNVDLVTKAKPLCARAGVVLKWDFQQMLFSNLSMESMSVYFVWKFPGVSYCLMLTFGSFALADYNTYGVGVFEVGTFYALCKIYLSVLVYVVLCCFNDWKNIYCYCILFFFSLSRLFLLFFFNRNIPMQTPASMLNKTNTNRMLE